MNCIFKDMVCVRGGKSHDDCRRCRNVPDFSNEDLEARYLCAIGGYRENDKKRYGSLEHKEPTWLKILIKKYDGFLHIPCSDHQRYLKDRVILEPYSASDMQIKDLIKFCNENGLEFAIDGDSAWFPGRTFRIIITRKDA